MKNTLTVGKLAKEANLNIETIRYYERIELLPYAKRNSSGYRYYTDDDIKRLHFIALAKRHGFSLKEIKELLELRVDPVTTCVDVRTRAEEKVKTVDEKIAELQQMKKALKTLINSCHGHEPASECPILEAFDE
jgi:MerR family transcriptional regulator, copper efflux regulator